MDSGDPGGVKFRNIFFPFFSDLEAPTHPVGALDPTSKLNELLALEEKAEGAGREIPLHPPGWGPLAAGRILSEAGSTKAQGGEAADRVVGRLVQLYWKGKFEGQPRRALAALSQIGGAAVPRHFLQAAESPNPQVRESAAAALGEFSGTKVRDGLRSLLDDPEASVRAAACLAAGKQEDPSSTAPLVERLRDPSGRVRRAAAEALAPAGDPEATPPLLKALEDPGIAVRKRAAEALGRIGDPAVLDALAERLRTGTDSEKWSAAEALADWSAPEAVPPPGGRAPRRLRQGPKAGRVCPGTPSLPRRGGGAGRIASGRIGPGPGPGGLRPGPDEIAGGRAVSGPGPGGRK